MNRSQMHLVVFGAVAAILGWSCPVRGASGVIDFAVNPGFTIVDGGSPNVVVNVRTGQSVMDLTMSRDQAVERVTLPIGTTFSGNGVDYKARLRFAVTSTERSARADILAGFFGSSEGTASGDSTTVAVIEPPGSSNSPARTFGGAYDRRSLDIQFSKWYVYDFEFQAVPETAVVRLYDGDGTTLIDQILGGNTSGMGDINLVGFGNEDRSDDRSRVTAVIDFMTWAVNETLPADPAFAPNSAIAIPEPANLLLATLWGVGGALACPRRRRVD